MPDLSNTIRVAVSRHNAKKQDQWSVSVINGSEMRITRIADSPALSSKPVEPTHDQFVGWLKAMPVGERCELQGSQYADRFQEFALWIDSEFESVEYDIDAMRMLVIKH